MTDLLAKDALLSGLRDITRHCEALSALPVLFFCRRVRDLGDLRQAYDRQITKVLRSMNEDDPGREAFMDMCNVWDRLSLSVDMLATRPPEKIPDCLHEIEVERLAMIDAVTAYEGVCASAYAPSMA